MSTDEQKQSGLGLEAQRAAIASAAERLKLELLGVEADEGVSGSIPPMNRQGLARAVALLTKGDVLLVAKRDRLGRSSLENGLLERTLARAGVRIVSAAGEGTENDDPVSVFLRTILDAVAQLERDMIRKRTKDALGAKRARGERSGAIPYGYRLEGGRLVEDSEEQAAIAAMMRMRREGAGYARVAKALARDGHKPRGSKWFPQSVRTILETQARHPSGPSGTTL